MEKRKEAVRRRTLKGAKIIFNNKHSTMACILRNLTSTGAKLEMPSTAGIPDAFTLASDDGTMRRECVVRWRKGDAMGVEFTA